MLTPVEIKEDALKASLGGAEHSFGVQGGTEQGASHLALFSMVELGSWVPRGRSDVWSGLRPAVNQCLK